MFLTTLPRTTHEFPIIVKTDSVFNTLTHATAIHLINTSQTLANEQTQTDAHILESIRLNSSKNQNPLLSPKTLSHLTESNIPKNSPRNHSNNMYNM